MRKRGFTLLEVMIALAVFALAAVMLGSGYVNVLNAYEAVGRSTAHDEDVSFARAQLLAEADRNKAEQGDDFESANGRRVIWRSKIDPTATADLFQVTFTCEITDTNDRTRRPPVTEKFMLLRPTWSEGIDTTKLRQTAKDRIVDLRKKTS
jgi:general secretion pathway protein I